jgi:aryl-alcohol dehydrogenase-like predicted oxidoreductase
VTLWYKGLPSTRRSCDLLGYHAGMQPQAPRSRFDGTRKLGHLRLPVSPIGLGLAALGRPAYINLGHAEDLGPDRSVGALRRRTHAVLDAAYTLGVRYFDAARSYGRAEEFLASWLAERGISTGEVTVGSKWGYEYTGGWRVDVEKHEVKDLGVSALRRQLYETRVLLGERLDLYQMHSATLESGVLEDDAVLSGLKGLKKTGVAVGLSVTGPRQAETIERALELGVFDTIQATWNLLERSASAALARAHEAGLGVIVKEALANGRLAAREGGVDEGFLAVARERGQSPDTLALSAALAQPWADVVLSGAATVETLRSNLLALEGPPYDQETDRRLLSVCEEREHYWSERANLPWT